MSPPPSLGDAARANADTMIVPRLLCRWDGTIRAIAYSAFVAGAAWQLDQPSTAPRCLLEPEGDPAGGELPERRPLPGSEAVSAAWKDIQPDGD